MGAGPEADDTDSDGKPLGESKKARMKPKLADGKPGAKDKAVSADADDVDDPWDNLPV
ncbi:MAG: hypothetical protein ACU0CA_16890 [Paracoccaceae bacterium]